MLLPANLLQARVANEIEEYDRKLAILTEAQQRPWSPTELENIMRGVARYGNAEVMEQDDRVYAALSTGRRFEFLHRRPEDIQSEWEWMFKEAKRKERRKWNWKRWPWDSEFNWGGLLVLPAEVRILRV